jgi:hypothetical protein
MSLHPSERVSRSRYGLLFLVYSGDVEITGISGAGTQMDGMMKGDKVHY